MNLLIAAAIFMASLAIFVFGLAWLLDVKPGDDDFRSGNRRFNP